MSSLPDTPHVTSHTPTQVPSGIIQKTIIVPGEAKEICSVRTNKFVLSKSLDREASQYMRYSDYCHTKAQAHRWSMVSTNTMSLDLEPGLSLEEHWETRDQHSISDSHALAEKSPSINSQVSTYNSYVPSYNSLARRLDKPNRRSITSSVLKHTHVVMIGAVRSSFPRSCKYLNCNFVVQAAYIFSPMTVKQRSKTRGNNGKRNKDLSGKHAKRYLCTRDLVANGRLISSPPTAVIHVRACICTPWCQDSWPSIDGRC